VFGSPERRQAGISDAPQAKRATRATQVKAMSPDQCRQAREVLSWTQGDLARAAGLMPLVLAAFEDGRGVLSEYESALREALEGVGIGFPFEIANGTARSAGVAYSPRDLKGAH
jgi:DNA-binding transcriptional regulator YiaG